MAMRLCAVKLSAGAFLICRTQRRTDDQAFSRPPDVPAPHEPITSGPVRTLHYLARMEIGNVRAMALDMPGTAVNERYGRPSYSVKKKTYLTVWADEQRAVLKLTPAQQAAFSEEFPDAYAPLAHKLGTYGWTSVQVEQVSERIFRYAMDLAWRNVAPKWLVLTRTAPPKG